MAAEMRTLRRQTLNNNSQYFLTEGKRKSLVLGHKIPSISFKSCPRRGPLTNHLTLVNTRTVWRHFKSLLCSAPATPGLVGCLLHLLFQVYHDLLS